MSNSKTWISSLFFVLGYLGRIEACTSVSHRPRSSDASNEVGNFPSLFTFAFSTTTSGSVGATVLPLPVISLDNSTSLEKQQQKKVLARQKLMAKLCPNSPISSASSESQNNHCQVVSVNKDAFDSSKLRFPLPLSVMDIDHPIHKFVHRSIVLKKVGVTQSATDQDAKTYSYKYKNQPVIFSVKKGKVFGSVKLTRSESPSVPELGGGRLFLRPCPNTATLITNNLGRCAH